MTSKSEPEIKRLGVTVFYIFYVIVGGAKAFILELSSFTLPHVGFLGALSLITAYGLFRMRKWSVLLATILFFPSITFGATTLYASIMQQTFYLILIVYLTMTVMAFTYVVAKRKSF